MTGPVDELPRRVESLAATPAGEALPPAAAAVVEELLDALERGAVRSAERAADGTWNAVPWVKRGILLGFRVGTITDMSVPPFTFLDKHTYPPQRFSSGSGVRAVWGRIPSGITATRWRGPKRAARSSASARVIVT